MFYSNRNFVFSSAIAVSVFVLTMVSLSVSVLAAPSFSTNNTYFGTTLAENFNASTIFNINGNNISFQVTITDDVVTPFDITEILDNVTFRLGRPDNTYVNFSSVAFNSGDTLPEVTNGTGAANNTFFINFTQSMFGTAGSYNFSWIAVTNATNQTVLTSEMAINKTSLVIEILLNGTNTNRAYEKGADTINVTAVANSTLGDLYKFLQISTNFTGVNASFAGNTSNTLNAIFNTTNTAGMTLANYTVSANLSSTAGQNYTFSQNNTLFIILRDTTAPAISGFSISPSITEQGQTITVSTTGITDHDGSSNTFKVTGPTGTVTSVSYTAGTSATFTSTGQIGTYTAQIIATDPSGNSVTSSGTFEIRSSGGGGSSSGGGGGSSSGTSKETRYINVGANGATVTLNKVADHGVVDIEIQVNNPANSVQISVQKLAGEPASVTQTVSGSVYRYVEITKSGTADSNLKSATVKFEVESSWISENDIDASTISLNRYSDGAWQKLATRLVSSDSTKFTFEADTPGFSTFAITGNEIEVEPAPQQPSTPTEEPTTETPTEEQAPTESVTSNVWVIAGIVAAAVIGIAVYAARSRKHRGKK